MTAEIQKVVKAVNVSCTSEVNESALMKLNKNPLAKIVENLLNLIEQNVELCKCAAGKIDQLKSEKIADQKMLIEIQQTQMSTVQDTVKCEIKSWADVVKKNNNQRNVKQLTENPVKQAVRAVNEENRRFKNLMICGCPEQKKEADFEVMKIKTVKDVFDEANEFLMPRTYKVCGL